MSYTSFFDWPYAIEKLAITRGSVNQTTGEWTKETFTVSQITGNFTTNMLIGERGGMNTLLEEGKACLYTSTLLVVGDKVRVHLDASGTNYDVFRVIGVTRPEYSLINKYVPEMKRAKYDLEREANG